MKLLNTFEGCRPVTVVIVSVIAVVFAGEACLGVTFTSDTLIDTGDATYDGQDVVVDGCVLTVTIPKDGVTGHYLLRLERLDGPYMRCWLTQAPEKRVVLVKGEELELGAFWGTRFWFHVPQDCTGFRIGAKPWNRATRYGFAVYDGQGRFVDAKGWYYNSQLDKLPTHWLDIKVPADARGTWWNIPYTCAKGIHFIWPKELPPYLADSPHSGFLPDPEYLRLVAGRE